MEKLGINTDKGPALEEIIAALSERSKTLVEMAQSSTYFFQDFEHFDEKAAKKNFKKAAIAPLQYLLDEFKQVETWIGKDLHQIVLSAVDQLDLKLGKIAQPLRVAVTGSGASPSIDITLELIGKQRVLARIQKAIDYIESQS